MFGDWQSSNRRCAAGCESPGVVSNRADLTSMFGRPSEMRTSKSSNGIDCPHPSTVSFNVGSLEIVRFTWLKNC